MLEVVFPDPIVKGKTHVITQDMLKEMSSAEIYATISNIPTPKSFQEVKQGNDYVYCYYMRDIANFFFPGWRYEIDKTEVQVDPDGNWWQTVLGRITWYEGDGEIRVMSNLDAHRIQFSSRTKSFSGLDNDVKSTGTDNLKKLLNMGMHICDDVYRWSGPLLLECQREYINDRIAEAIKGKQLNPKQADFVDKATAMMNRENWKSLIDTVESF